MRWLRSKLEPASRHWGIERGKPIDRVYLEHFLTEQKDEINGTVFEIGGRYYTKTYGGNVERSITYDVVEGDEVDIVGDLSTGVGLVDGTFDCMIVVQTLMMIHDIQSAVDNIYRSLKPGGVALVTVNFIAPNCEDPCHEMWQWNISPNAARKLFVDRFGSDKVEVFPYGNYAAASSFLAGMAAEEVELDYWNYEPGYEVLIGVRAQK